MTLGFSSLKIEDNDEELSSIFGIELLATQTNSKGGKDMRKLEPESLESQIGLKKTINWSVAGNIQF